MLPLLQLLETNTHQQIQDRNSSRVSIFRPTPVLLSAIALTQLDEFIVKLPMDGIGHRFLTV